MNLADAQTVMQQLPAAFEHFNEVHPHSSLKMKSAREFRRQQLQTREETGRADQAGATLRMGRVWEYGGKTTISSHSSVATKLSAIACPRVATVLFSALTMVVAP